MSPIQTSRLLLREAVAADAPFIHTLLNSPGWLEHIGDRGIHGLPEAEAYISSLAAAHKKQGFGLWLICFRESGEPAGLCGLLQRDYLEHPDLGFAVHPAYSRQGITREASLACVDFAWDKLAAPRLFAITSPKNKASQALLESIGFRFQSMVRPPGTADEVCCYAMGRP